MFYEGLIQPKADRWRIKEVISSHLEGPEAGSGHDFRCNLKRDGYTPKHTKTALSIRYNPRITESRTESEQLLVETLKETPQSKFPDSSVIVTNSYWMINALKKTPKDMTHSLIMNE